MKLFMTALVTASVGTCAQAQAVRTERNISLELAAQLASDAMAACTGSGFNVSVAVVDRGGSVRVSHSAGNSTTFDPITGGSASSGSRVRCAGAV